MNPVIFNCVLLYLTVILLSLAQSRLRLLKDDPLTYVLLLVFVPFFVLGKAKGIKTWTELTGFEIFGYTIVMAYINAKRILPKVNEAYIFAYTLFHWYLLVDTANLKGVNFWVAVVLVISVYPTYLIVKSAFEHKKLDGRSKIILYYWFLFTIVFTYIDQVALDIVTPITTLTTISFSNSMVVLVSAIQLYFISTILSLLFVGIPFFHLSRSSNSFKVRWRSAMEDWREILTHKLDNYIEYQVSTVQVVYITIFSAILFYIDVVEGIRAILIFVYTVLLPLVFFYLKMTPKSNIEANG